MINKVILVGNLGKDPELKKFDSGNAVTKLTLATNENYKDRSGEWQTATEWHNVVVWGQAAERISTDLKKGTLVYVEGKLTTRKWQDQNGNDRYITEVRAMVTKRLEKREGSGAGITMPSEQDEFPPVSPPKVENSQNGASSSSPSEEDDLPF